MRVALRRVAATAGAFGRRKLERRARKIVRSLSADRQLEVDRALLARISRMGLLSEDAGTALAARWESRPDTSGSRSDAIMAQRRVRRLQRKLRVLAARPQPDTIPRLLAERLDAEAALAATPNRNDDETLHRYRLLAKRARYLAEDLVACGRREFEPAAARERAAQDALGRWNDLRLFLERIGRERRLAQWRGAVRLASELDELARGLEGPLAKLRREARETTRRLSNVVPHAARSA